MMTDLQKYYEELLTLRRWLHSHPELSMKERETSKYIACYLEKCGMEVQRTGEVGVIGTLYAGKTGEKESSPGVHRTVAVRAEIDALPIQENTGLPFASENPGVMHACGHDCITAVALVLAKVLCEQRERLACNVRFIFEPGEEIGQGAGYMMENGALEHPSVDELLIFHFANQEPRGMEIQKSITTAAVHGITFRVKGKSAHWFESKNGIDAMLGAAMLVQEIHHMNQHFQAEYPFVLGFGVMQAGTAGNIMADEAVISGSVRTFSRKDDQEILKELEQRIEKIQEETGVRIEIEHGREIPPLQNDPEMVKRGIPIGRRLLKERFLLGENPFLVGDNAAFYAERVPAMRTVFLAGKEGEACCPVHNPGFDLDERVMLDALKFLYQMIR